MRRLARHVWRGDRGSASEFAWCVGGCLDGPEGQRLGNRWLEIRDKSVVVFGVLGIVTCRRTTTSSMRLLSCSGGVLLMRVTVQRLMRLRMAVALRGGCVVALPLLCSMRTGGGGVCEILRRRLAVDTMRRASVWLEDDALWWGMPQTPCSSAGAGSVFQLRISRRSIVVAGRLWRVLGRGPVAWPVVFESARKEIAALCCDFLKNFGRRRSFVEDRPNLVCSQILVVCCLH